MKIAAEDYDFIKTFFSEKKDKFEGHINVLVEEGKANDFNKRLRWDVFHAFNSQYQRDHGERFTRKLYQYLDDTHIDTALKKIMTEIGFSPETVNCLVENAKIVEQKKAALSAADQAALNALLDDMRELGGFPEGLINLSGAFCKALKLKGICDPAYIANRFAMETGWGDGQINFFDTGFDPEKISNAVHELANVYGSSLEKTNVTESDLVVLANSAVGNGVDFSVENAFASDLISSHLAKDWKVSYNLGQRYGGLTQLDGLSPTEKVAAMAKADFQQTNTGNAVYQDRYEAIWDAFHALESQADDVCSQSF